MHKEGSEAGSPAYMHTASQIDWRLWSARFIFILVEGIDGTDIRWGFLGKTLPDQFESDSSGLVPLGPPTDNNPGNKAFGRFRIIGNESSRVGKNR